MNAKRIYVTAFIIVLPLLSLLQTGTLYARSAGEEAGDILKTSGVKGGLIVHLGCGNGKLTAALRANDSYLVHGLDRNSANVKRARTHIDSAGLYGPVSVDHWDGKTLPYSANLINLIVSSDECRVKSEEITRVLAPCGVALVKGNLPEHRTLKPETSAGLRGWTKLVKPRPAEIDEWTHFLYDASNNAVSKDTAVAPLRHLQWAAGPHWARSHAHTPTTSGCVSAGGRLFYFEDEGSRYSVLLPSRWKLTARDGFNGILLWQRDIPAWYFALGSLGGTPEEPRRLVAVGDRVYVTLGIAAPVTALDAATGETVRTYKGTEGANEIIVSEGMLFVVAIPEAKKDKKKWRGNPSSKVVVALKEATGEVSWRRECKDFARLTLACDAERVYLCDEHRITGLNRADGRVQWRSEPVEGMRMGHRSRPTLVVQKDVVLFTGWSGKTRRLRALSAKDGKTLWEEDHPLTGYASSPLDILVIGDTAWAATGLKALGRDLHTGKTKADVSADVTGRTFHHRCHRNKATTRYLFTAKYGIEFMEVETRHWTWHPWIRGACNYGIMPANGMIYAPQSPCRCILEARLLGFCALSAASEAGTIGAVNTGGERLQTGDRTAGSKTVAPEKDAWPTYRHDMSRSGRASCTLPASLREAWRTKVGGKLTSLTVAGKKVFVASSDRHRLHALDAVSGRKVWTFITGGPIDSPPTIFGNLCIFGCTDGNVYCLAASDGRLVWRFRAAPANRHMMYFGKLESVWPLHGSVLVLAPSTGSGQAIVYCVAGRSPAIDGGLRFLRLDARTGKKLSERVSWIHDSYKGKGKKKLEHLGLPDILSSDGRNILMRTQAYDIEWKRGNRSYMHLARPAGFLNDQYWQRNFWQFCGTSGVLAARGRIIAFDNRGAFSFGLKKAVEMYKNKLSIPLEHTLFRSGKEPKGKGALTRQWEQKIPVLARAMVLTENKVLLAGPPNPADLEAAFAGVTMRSNTRKLLKEHAKLLREQDALLEGAKEAVVWAASRDDGAKISELKLDAVPVFDGMAAAYGKIYMSMKDGTVRCLAGR